MSEPKNYPELAREAHTLLARCQAGVLSTLDPRDGIPYASLVELIQDGSGVLMCLSDLAAHSTNLLKDSRASILVREPLEALHGGSVLELQRLTLMGEVEKRPRSEELIARWLVHHPEAEGYVHFSDFNFYGLTVHRARHIAGFGRMGWIDEQQWRAQEPLEWAAQIQGVITHMNEDHVQNLIDYVHAERGEAPERAVMLGVDELGFDVEAHWGEARRERVRLMFSSPAVRFELVRKELVSMAHSARARIAGTL